MTTEQSPATQSPTDPRPEHPNVEKVRTALAEAGIDGAVEVLPSAVRTAAAAAEALSQPGRPVEVGQIANSLVFAADGGPLLVMASGAHRVDTDRLAAELGYQAIRRADPDFVRRHTSQAIGGVAPTGHPSQLPTVIDTALARYDQIWAAGGIPHAIFPLTYDDLVRLTGGKPVDVG